MRQDIYVATPNTAIPADRKPLRKAQEGLEQRVANRAARQTQSNEQLTAIPARSVGSVAKMLRVVLFSHTDGAEKERGYIEFTELLVEHVNDWAYRCQPPGLLTLEQVKEIVATLLWSEANSGIVGEYRWVKMAGTQPALRSVR